MYNNLIASASRLNRPQTAGYNSATVNSNEDYSSNSYGGTLPTYGTK